MKVEYKMLWTINEEEEVSHSLVNQAFTDGQINNVIFIPRLIFFNDILMTQL